MDVAQQWYDALVPKTCA